MRRQILHVDMNSFYASVEQAFHPSLRGKAIAVTGNPEKRHGIILAKSPEAKAKGVQTGEAIWQAKQKCPELLTVKANFERYQIYSRLAQSIYREYTDRVEPYGLDECWLDVSHSSRLFGDGWTIAAAIRQRVREELGVTVSVGVSDNKVFAKLGSDLRKPDAQTRLDASNFREYVWPLPVSSLLFVGRQTTKALLSFGITTIGELARANSRLIAHRFHRNGIKLQKAAQGKDDDPVLPYGVRPIAKSISCGTTFARDLYTQQDISLALLSLADQVQSRLICAGLRAEGIGVWVRDRRLCVTHATGSLPYPTQSAQTLVRFAIPLAHSLFDPRMPLRSLTLCATALCPAKEAIQTLLFADIVQHDKWERLADTVEDLRMRYGRQAAGPATLSSFALADLNAPRAPMPFYLSGCHALSKEEKRNISIPPSKQRQVDIA